MISERLKDVGYRNYHSGKWHIDGMPIALEAISYLVPARYFIVVTRGIFLKGVGIEVLWPQALFMLAFAALGLGLATRSFRKELT